MAGSAFPPFPYTQGGERGEDFDLKSKNSCGRLSSVSGNMGGGVIHTSEGFRERVAPAAKPR